MKNCIDYFQSNCVRLQYTLLFVFCSLMSFAQSSDSPIDLPTIIPPSPTVSSLMSFEEVPVSYYTGQPNISIPLYSKDIGFGLTMPFALNYSTSGVRINERSGWVGTGWSLQAGGVVSRTVQGIPDEYALGEFGDNRTGAFHIDTFWDYYDSGTSLTERQKFMWEANGSTVDRYDYQLDTFQFNVLGLSGSFVIVNNNGTLEAKLLDKNQRIKVDINYGETGVNANPYKLNYFTITDTNGNVYKFDQKEILTSEHLSNMVLFDGTSTSSGNNDTIVSTNAWYLTSIESSNGELLATLEYINNDYVLYATSYSRTTNEIINRDSNYNATIADPANAQILKPKTISSYVTSSGNTQKLLKITFEKDQTYINFGLGADNPETGGKRLSSLSIRDKHHNENKKFILTYEDVATRMWLTNVEESANGFSNDYGLEYNDKQDLPSFNSPSDDWGYNNGASTLNVSNENCTVGGYYDYDAITVGLLKKISYPTGGEKEFTFEQNTVSFQGGGSTSFGSSTGLQLTDDEYREFNPENWDYDTYTMTDSGPAGAGVPLSGVAASDAPIVTGNFVISQEQDIIFKRDIVVTFTGGTSGNVQDVLDNSFIEFFDASNTSQGKVFLSTPEYILRLPPGTYTAKLTSLNTNVNLEVNSCLAYNRYQPTVKKYIYGGGVRIKDIKFNDQDANVVKKVSYHYDEIPTGAQADGQPDLNVSSGTIDGNLRGALREYELQTSPYLCTPSSAPRYKVSAKIPTAQLSKGSYVGYKTVRVSEFRNGSRVFDYTTARDFPSPSSTFTYPYTPAPTLDYERGLLLSEVVYKEPTSQFDVLGDKLKETINEYETEKYQEALNYALYSVESDTKQFYDNFSAFSTYGTSDQAPNCNPTPLSRNCNGGCTNIPFFVLSDTIFSTWVKLKQKTVKDYFYEAGNTSQTEMKQEFVYNNTNYRISEEKMMYDKGGVEEELTTKYYYPYGGLPQNYGTTGMITRLQSLNKTDEVLAVEKYKGNVLLSQVKTRYFEPETNLVLPNTVHTAKSYDTPEERLVYHKYDSYGNPLEVSKKDGTHIIYVWGYDHSYPIAKIVNHSYTNISTSLQTAINEAVAASNNDNTADITVPIDEDVLRNELEEIRNHNDLVDAQVNTLTYNPLVGVTSMIDARGYNMFYEYDNLNRLIHVKDKDDYILSKNEYYYGSPLSYVKTTGFQVKTLNGVTNFTTTATLTNDEKIESITYLDGLGRSLQTITKQAGGNKQDVIVPFLYDKIGRQAIEYLPYANKNQAPGTGSLSYRNYLTLLDDLEAYYVTEYPEDQISSTSINAFTEKRFEGSPLNRVLEQGAPGKDWLIDRTADTDHTIKLDYQTNSFEEVELFKVIFPTLDTEQPQLFYDGFYGVNELYKTVTKDENWQPSPNCSKAHTTEEFKNSLGQIILKRTYTVDSNNDCIPHHTYYTYDDFGNLTYVLSPKGSDLVLASKSYKGFSMSADYLDIVPTDKKGQPVCKGSGKIEIDVDGTTNTITVDFDVSFDDPINIKNGAVIQLYDNIPNMVIGTILNGDYTISVQDGYLFIAGSGSTISVNETIVADLPTSIVDEEYVDDLCYQYHYDKTNRLIEKKIPQKGWEYIIYDKLDRPVMSQDQMLNSNSLQKWMFTKYDQFDRVVYTGIYETYYPKTRIEMQAEMDNSTLYESASVSTNTIGSTSVYYSNNVFPQFGTTLHTVNYYDTYNTTLSNAFPNPVTVYGKTISSDTKSLVIGSLVRVLGTTDWITSVSYYDDKGQPIYIGSENDYLSTTDVIKTDLSFIGTVITTETNHIKDTNNPIIITDRFTYDHANRLLTQKQQITGEAEELIVKNEYDELGQLINKDVGNTEANPLQNIEYDYNIRGWLKQINDPNAIGNDLFSFKINYNSTDLGMGNDALFNGNISETIWKTANDITNNITRGYAYDYDALNRITSGNMAEDTGNGYKQAAGYHLNGLMYDKNGNIISLKRTGASDVFDDLTYKYNGNQLGSVIDLISNQQTEGFIDGHVGGADYFYDANGNMTQDENKGITNILYNHLNLPIEVEFNSSLSHKINYIYDARGLKLKKVVNDNSNITNTEYAGNYIYENSTLKFFSHPEGYVEPDGPSYEYIYQYKDHLGNIRLSYKNDALRDVMTFNDLTTNVSPWIAVGSSTLSIDQERLKCVSTEPFKGTQYLEGLENGKHYTISFDIDLSEIDANFNFVAYSPNSGAILNEPISVSGHYTFAFTGSNTETHQFIFRSWQLNGSSSTFYLDNITVTESEDVDLSIVEENNYYPFGLKHKGYNYVINGTDHPYGFGGKEEQNELDLGWMDITARNYDPALGRWMNIDPLAEMMRRHSPYNYAFNNPVFFMDYDGMAPTGPGDDLKVYDGDSVAIGENVTNELDEVVVTATKRQKSVTSKPARDRWTLGKRTERSDSSYRRHGLYGADGVTRDNYAYGGSISMLSYGYDNTGTNNLYGQLHGETGVHALKVKLDGRLGDRKNNVAADFEGSLYELKAGGDLELYSDPNGKQGVEMGLNLSATTAMVSLTPSVTILGYKIGFTLGGSVGSAHIGGRAAATFDNSNGQGELTGVFDAGFGAGFKVGISVTNTSQDFNRKRR